MTTATTQTVKVRKITIIGTITNPGTQQIPKKNNMPAIDKYAISKSFGTK